MSTKSYERDDFGFEIVNFIFLDGDFPRSTSYGAYIFQLMRFARASSYVTDFNTRNKLLTQKLLKQGFGILGQVWYLIISIPDLCNLTFFGIKNFAKPFLNFIDDTMI